MPCPSPGTKLAASQASVCGTGCTGTWRLDTGSDQSCGQWLVSRWLARCAPSRLRSGPQASSLYLLSLGWEAVPCMYWGDRSPTSQHWPSLLTSALPVAWSTSSPSLAHLNHRGHWEGTRVARPALPFLGREVEAGSACWAVAGMAPGRPVPWAHWPFL